MHIILTAGRARACDMMLIETVKSFFVVKRLLSVPTGAAAMESQGTKMVTHLLSELLNHGGVCREAPCLARVC